MDLEVSEGICVGNNFTYKEITSNKKPLAFMHFGKFFKNFQIKGKFLKNCHIKKNV